MRNKLLQIELTNDCNGNCCWCSNDKMSRERGFMSLDMVRKVAEKIHTRQDSLGLHFYSESMLHPEFFEIIELLNNYKINTFVFTNGSLINDETIEKFVNSNGLDRIYITLNRFKPLDEIKKLIIKAESIKIILIVLNLPKEMDEFNVNMIELLAWIEKNRLSDKVELSGSAYDFPEKIDGKYGRCFKNKSGECFLRKSSMYSVLWDGRLVDCIKDYNCEKDIGTIDDLDKLSYNTKKCPY